MFVKVCHNGLLISVIVWNTVLDAVHECPKGLADYNPNSILCFWQKCVSLSPACDPGEKPAMALFQV